MKKQFKTAVKSVDFNTIPIDELVDEYARLKAEADDIEKKLDAAKKRFAREGAGSYDGNIIRAVVCEMPGRETVDTKGLIAFLKVSANTLTNFTKRGNPFYSIKLVGR